MVTRHQLAKYVGIRVKETRLDKRLTQVELSRKTGISQNFLSNIENGTISVDMYDLFIISDALAKVISDFLPFQNKIGGDANETSDTSSGRPERVEL